MGVLDRPVSAGDGFLEGDFASPEQRSHGGDGHDGHFRDERIADDEEIRRLQAELDAPPRFVNDTVGGDEGGGPPCP